MLDLKPVQNILDIMFHQVTDESNLFMIIDAAQDPRIYSKLKESKRPHACLYDGWATPEPIKAVAPYIIRIKEADEFLHWCFSEGLLRNWMLFFSAHKRVLDDMRLHFKRFSIVKNEKGEKLLFRYYDPRVFKTFLPTCNRGEYDFLFKDIDYYWIAEDKQNHKKEAANIDGLFIETVKVEGDNSASLKPSYIVLDQYDEDGNHRLLGAEDGSWLDQDDMNVTAIRKAPGR